jgi:hypothetical protein
VLTRHTSVLLCPCLLSDHFGTLIVCLPTSFKGGQLVLRHIDHNSTATPPSKTFDWGATTATGTTQGLQWAAFYADTGTLEPNSF